MFKDGRYINAGTNEFYRWGRKAVERVEACMVAENGYYSIPVDGGKYWTFGTSDGKYGEFAKIGNTCFSVNKGGFMWAKEGTDKAEKFIAGLKAMIEAMNEKHNENVEED